MNLGTAYLKLSPCYHLNDRLIDNYPKRSHRLRLGHAASQSHLLTLPNDQIISCACAVLAIQTTAKNPLA